MSIERLTITLTSEMADAVKSAVGAGQYASSSELVREALRDWQHKRALQERELEALRSDLQQGLDDLSAGRVQDFDPERIVKQGEKRLAKPEPSA
jgi:antitoxin ParD1/3/4